MPPEAEEALDVRPGTGIDVTGAADAADDVWNALERPAGNSDDEPFSSEDVYKTTERYWTEVNWNFSSVHNSWLKSFNKRRKR